MPAAGRYTWYTAKGCAQRTGEFKITKVGKDHANCVGGGRTDSNVVQPMVGLELEELMFWYSLVGAYRPPKEAVLVAIACLEQELLGFGALSWEPESDSCGENSRWKGLGPSRVRTRIPRQVRVHLGKSGYSSGEK